MNHRCKVRRLPGVTSEKEFAAYRWDGSTVEWTDTVTTPPAWETSCPACGWFLVLGDWQTAFDRALEHLKGFRAVDAARVARAAAVLAAAVAWKARYDEMFDEPPARGTTMRPIYDALLSSDTTEAGDG